MKTDCKKCGTEMPPNGPIKGGFLSGATMTITAYACLSCGHWNDLKRRKGYAEHRQALAAGAQPTARLKAK